MKIKVKPRDIQPGDKIERINLDLDTVWMEVSRVLPIKMSGRTKAYKVYMEEAKYLQPGWLTDPLYSHLRPFMVRIHQHVTVDRKECDGTGLLPRTMGEEQEDGTRTGLCVSCQQFHPMREVIPPSKPEWPREFRLQPHTARKE